MTSARRIGALPTAACGVLVGLMLAWFFGRGDGATLHAQAAPPTPMANSTIAFTADGPNSTQFLYLIDTRSQAFAIYRVDPQEVKGTVKLEAARQYQWDLKLGEYNNQPPEVAAVEAMMNAARR